MGIDEKKYKGRQNNFEKKVIQEPLRELNEIDECEFYLEYCKIKDYNTTVGWHFEIKEKYRTLKINKSDSKEKQEEKRIFNNEREIIESHQKEIEKRAEEIYKTLEIDDEIFREKMALTKAKSEIVEKYK